MKELKSKIFIMIAAILWGTTGTAESFLVPDVHPFSIGALRLFIGGSVLIIPLVMKRPAQLRTCLKKEILLAALMMALFQPMFFLSVKLTGVAISTIVAIGSAPVFSGLLEIKDGKKLSKKWMSATSCSVMGCLMITLQGDSISIDYLGILCALVAGMSYAMYVRFTSRAVKVINANMVNSLTMFYAGMMLLPLLYVTYHPEVMSIRTISVVLHLSLMTVALAYTLFANGLQQVLSSTAVTLTLIEPLTAFLLGIFVVKETMSFSAGIGVLLMVCGLIIMSFSKKK